jgi:hypothetical protein
MVVPLVVGGPLLGCMVSLVWCMQQQVGEGRHPRVVEVPMGPLRSSSSSGSVCWGIICRSWVVPQLRRRLVGTISSRWRRGMWHSRTVLCSSRG